MSSTARKSPEQLADYRRKRSFDRTPEPKPDEGVEQQPDAGSEKARFVVHEHQATRLHWDLRLEHKGALASWAVPNGIPEDPKHNRKAVHVEDHPLSYIDFEGTIPAGSYGAGEVSVWDRGTYTCEKWQAGKIIIVLQGVRLRGRYALFHAGRSEKDWMIHRMDPPTDRTAQEMPEFVEPMLARLSALPSAESEWAFEVKWDGVRAIAHSQPGRIHLFSRNGNDVTRAYPELRALNRVLGSHEAILDGEIVAFDEAGRPSFAALQPRMHQRGEAVVRRLAKATPATYILFDLLWLDGHSLMGLPYSERRTQLDALKLEGEHWRAPAFHAGEGAAMLAATREQGLEGVMAKRLDSRYASGRRDGGWLKIKHSQRQELVIGGWTQGKGSRSSTIGALHLGVYDKHDSLRYAGRVGTGFDEHELERLAGLLAPLTRGDSPFAGAQPPRGAHFVEPRLVCEVEFTQWTKDGLLRHPSYKGLREDKPATEVVRECVSPTSEVDNASTRKVASTKEVAPTRKVASTRREASTRKVAPGSGAVDIQALVEQGHRVRGGVEIELEGRTLKLTNLDKLLYPKAGFTKADLIVYYAAIAPVLLPHLAGRPLTLKRYPDGVEGEYFYEKQCPKHRPSWVQTTAIWSESNKREIDYCLCEDLSTLVWIANLAAIELHPSLSRAVAIECPTALAFDLDPGAPAGIVECCEVALELYAVFLELGMRAFAKTSGSKGLQVYVPLNDREASYEQTKPFAHAVADLLERRHPELVVSRIAKARRRGKVLIDWSQNDEHKTTVSVYSLRAMESPTVSTPVSWAEIEAVRDSGDLRSLEIEQEVALERVHDRGDLFAEVLTLHQSLPALG
jgi:bifunctional non-homologous end joining protein LigD